MWTPDERSDAPPSPRILLRRHSRPHRRRGAGQLRAVPAPLAAQNHAVGGPCWAGGTRRLARIQGASIAHASSKATGESHEGGVADDAVRPTTQDTGRRRPQFRRPRSIPQARTQPMGYAWVGTRQGRAWTRAGINHYYGDNKDRRRSMAAAANSTGLPPIFFLLRCHAACRGTRTWALSCARASFC